MKTLDVESVKTLIQSRLSKNEKLLSCSQAHGTESIYVAITKDTYYYKIFRLSGHQALQSFGQETVSNRHSDFWLKSSISNLLYKEGNWYFFEQSQYLALRLLKSLQSEGVYVRLHKPKDPQFYIFVPDSKKGSGLKYQFNQTYQKTLKKLLRGGLLACHQRKMVYLTKAAYAYLEVMQKDTDFQTAWQQLSKSAHLEKLPERNTYISKVTYRFAKQELHYQLSGKSIEPQKIYGVNTQRSIFKRLSNRLVCTIKVFLKEKVGQVLSSLKQTFSSKEKLLETPQAVSLERNVHTNILSKTKLNNERDSIKQAWDANINHRSNENITSLVSSDSLDKLAQFRQTLSEG
jgi:hypothetical protein